MTYKEAVTADAEFSAAVEMFRADPCFRAMAHAAVSRAMQRHGRIDPETAERDAHSIATDAVISALAGAFHHDAEIKHLRQERDMWRWTAELTASYSFPPLFIRHGA